MTGQARLVARVAALLGVDVVATAPLQGGDLSAVHRLDLADGGTLIAKLSPHAASEGTMLEAIRAAGAPAPRVFACDGDLLVMERLDADGGPASAWGLSPMRSRRSMAVMANPMAGRPTMALVGSPSSTARRTTGLDFGPNGAFAAIFPICPRRSHAASNG